MFLPDYFDINAMIFNKRPIAISADYRPTFRITLIALVLLICSSRKKASLLKLHLFSWALKGTENMKAIYDLLANKRREVIHLWSIEPSLNRALRWGVSEGIFNFEGNKYLLTKKGERLAELAMNDNEILDKEKEFLRSIRKSLSEKKVTEISKNWLNSNA